MGESTNPRAKLRFDPCTVGVSRRYHHLGRRISGLPASLDLLTHWRLTETAVPSARSGRSQRAARLAASGEVLTKDGNVEWASKDGHFGSTCYTTLCSCSTSSVTARGRCSAGKVQAAGGVMMPNRAGRLIEELGQEAGGEAAEASDPIRSLGPHSAGGGIGEMSPRSMTAGRFYWSWDSRAIKEGYARTTT